MELKIEYLNVKDLKPYKKNARKHQAVRMGFGCSPG